jgi:uncharacterized protein with NRDE domain
MCLLLLSYRQIPDVPIVLAANREESPARPTVPPELVLEPDGASWFGGRDGIAGGTWLGVNSSGLVVGVTNRRDPPAPPSARSRGLLCRDLLTCGEFSAAVAEMDRQMERFEFAGFNLLLASRDTAMVVEHGSEVRRYELPGGLHLLTNAGLNNAGDPRAERARWEFEAGRELDSSLPSMIAVGMNVCRSAEQKPSPRSESGGPLWGTVSSSVIAIPDHAATAEFYHAAGPPGRTPFVTHSELLQTVLGCDSTIRPRIDLHRMHLKGPWSYEWLDGSAMDRPPTGRVTMPADWESLFGAAAGRAVFRRRFHSPTNLEPDDCVWLAFDGVGGNGTVTVNGEVIGRLQASDRPQRLDMTARLQPFNETTVELEFDPTSGNAGGLYAPVAIEIESMHEW